ncbi:MAG: LacI family transcriptional regulator [Planctomycetota bacterium]|nr:LacI family transcriptional regulator [Planctomycetota bacterium]
MPRRPSVRPASASIETVAEAAGVSVATVSRAFHDAPKLAGPTRGRVLEAARRLGYYPRVVPNRRNKVAIVLAAGQHLGDDPYAAQLVGALLERLHARKMRVILQPARSSGDLIAAVEEGFFDALAVLGGPAGSAAWNEADGGGGLRELADSIPVLVLNHDLGAPTHAVLSDHAQGGRLAVEHLLAKGHRRIAYAAPGARSEVLDARRAGARAALERAGLDAEEACGRGGEDLALVEILARAKARGATGLVLGRQQLTLPALRTLHLLGLRAPEDISVVGFEGRGVSAYTNPPLTTVRQPIAELGARAADRIVELLERGDDRKRRVRDVLLNELVERESVRVLKPSEARRKENRS